MPRCAGWRRCVTACRRGQDCRGTGTQILLPMLAALRPPGIARILGPTYAEHARAAALAGHETREVETLDALTPATLATVVNPDNPTGRVLDARTLGVLAAAQRAAGGLLVVDEAFHDATPEWLTAIPLVPGGAVVVLRSFGKFHGLAGVRLGFAVAADAVAEHLEALLGPWAVAGPALLAGLAAFADEPWAQGQRVHLRQSAARLDRVLAHGGLRVLGGTPLFRLVQAPPGTHARLGRAGILVREFPHWPDRLRIGLPADEAGFARRAGALA
ncbi:aminotransferase class I/II-fold pyridoxal phosphate-dependent enzyme [Roseococcus sp. SDR]|uniref:aminotransferase class I/II-fold pyridoxal phosphate-dependent enzyme n=1 Tax=Roseococcus sp. SDR TaxID=2835532 RepID=UPI001BCBD158|nr:aminotransferase class I/II-fold pyridoxal phosphate-dependent enzyme [Roseococcus sp. SDR]MBS7792317.1 aminotransferase class I/II-fold pyridoxal phosphate-dependent enzyme [Roseococcus sp. SDR]MBV1847631.1 aminotransferase class I/II-fold pyridoxal phosphate-dependent enzyme [Roseococcus sp. SDR]